MLPFLEFDLLDSVGHVISYSCTLLLENLDPKHRSSIWVRGGLLELADIRLP